MNFQSESKADGSQLTSSHMMKTFFDTLSNSLQIRTKSSKETGSHYDPIQIRRLNPTRSRLLRPLKKWNCSPQRSNNSQKTKNYHSNKAFRSRKTTTRRKFPITVVKFSWPSFRILQTETPILALEDLDYNDFLYEIEESEAVAASYKIPPPPPRITVTVHLDNNPKKIFKTEHHQQLGDSFGYSNSDLHNVINIGHCRGADDHSRVAEGTRLSPEGVYSGVS